MRNVLGLYASYFNQKHGFTGRLWQGRFYSTVLDETHFWAALRYVERNPVRASIVERAEAYEWSSAAAHCGLRQEPLLVPLPTIPSFIGDWSSWIEGEDELQEIKKIRDTTKTGCPCGSSVFIEELEAKLGVPIRIRKPGRPKGRVGGQRVTLPFAR